MKLALILPGFSSHEQDWAIPALQHLACYLAKTHEVHVFSLRYPARGIYRLGNVTHHAMGGGVNFGLASMNYWQMALRVIQAEHRKRPFHLLHAFWVDEPALTAVFASKLLKIPVIASVGGGELVYFADIDYGTQKKALRRLIVRLALRGADAVTAGSHYQLDLCCRYGVPRNHLHFAPLGVHTDLFSPTVMPAWERPILIQAASLVAVKDQRLLLQVVEQVKTAVPNIHLILAGDGPLKSQLYQQADELGLLQHITWAEKVAHPQMAAVYQQAHLYVQTSRHESQGMSVLESMACGLPVVGTPVGVVSQVACQPATWDSSTLAHQIIEILQNRSIYKTYRHTARQTITEQFSLAKTAENYLNLYQLHSKNL